MNILALDAALSSCSAAVICDSELKCEIFENRLRGHAERLVPMCQEACEKSSLSFADIDYIAVTRGPGTFTGVRIGLAAAKGLSLALDIPLIGVTTFDVVARNVSENMGVSHKGRVAVAHDARRSEVYIQLFDFVAGEVAPVSEPQALPLDDVAGYLNTEVQAVVGTGAELIKPFLSEAQLSRLSFPEMNFQPNAGTIGRLAAEIIVSDVKIGEVIPLYLRAPDAVAAKPIVYPFQNQ